jgi:hypothetical protein
MFNMKQQWGGSRRQMPRHLDLILTCTGRTASGFYSRYLSIAGIPCGHEKIFTRYEVALKDGFHGERQDRPTGGRFPANLIHDGSDEVVGLFPVTTRVDKRDFKIQKTPRNDGSSGIYGRDTRLDPQPAYNDSGSAARFFKQINELKEESD